MPRTPRSYKTNAADKPVPVKATEAEMTRRISAIYKLLVLGYDRPYILQYASETWDASERSADDYMSRARALIDAQTSRDREEHLKIALSRLEMVFNAAYVSSQYKDALGAQHQLNKILALYAPVQQHIEVHHTWQDEAVSLIKSGEITYEAALETFDHDDRLVRELFAKAQVEVSTGQGQTS